MTKRSSANGNGRDTPTSARHPTRAKQKTAAVTQIDATFAVASDGTLLVNVSSLEDCHLEGRPLFIGAKLTEAEVQTAAGRIENAARELQGSICGRLLKQQTPKKPE